MCTSTVVVAEALPVQPDTVIGEDAVPRSGMGTSVALVVGLHGFIGGGGGSAPPV